MSSNAYIEGAISDFSHSITYKNGERQQESGNLLNKQNSYPDVSKLSQSLEYRNSSSADDALQRESTRHQTKEASTLRKIVIMTACLYLHVCMFGMVVSLGVIYVELISAFNTTRAKAALVQSLYMGTSIGGGVFFTGTITKYKAGDCIILASFVATLALFTSSFVNTIEVTIMLVGVVAGVAIGLNILGSFVVVNWTFGERRKMALSFLTLGATFGQILMPIITDALVEAYYWDGALLIISALMTFNCVPCGLILHYSELYFNKGDGVNRKETKWTACFTNIPFIIFLVIIILFATTTLVEQTFIVDLSESRGLSRELGASLLSINGVFGFIGRISGTTILSFRPDTRPELHLANAFLMWGVAHFLIIQLLEYWQMVFSIALRGLSAGLTAAFLPSMQLELRGRENYPQTVAVCNMLTGICQVIGGFLGGYSVDVTGNYNVIFYIATAAAELCFLCFIAIYFMIKYKNVGLCRPSIYQKI